MNISNYIKSLISPMYRHKAQNPRACHIYLCNVSPRGDTDTAEVNQAVHRLCQEHNLTMVDINKAFYDKQGKIIERYYSEGLLHLSSSGVKRLLGEIDREINIVENFENCAFKNRYQKEVLFVKDPLKQTVKDRAVDQGEVGLV